MRMSWMDNFVSWWISTRCNMDLCHEKRLLMLRLLWDIVIIETFRSKKQAVVFGCVDLEKVLLWFLLILRQSGVPEYLVNGVMPLHQGCKSAVSVEEELSDSFSKKVGVHQGSALSTLTFVTVVYVLTEYVRDSSLIDLLHAVNFALCGESWDEIMGKYQRWKRVLEGKCQRVNVKRTKAIQLL